MERRGDLRAELDPGKALLHTHMADIVAARFIERAAPIRFGVAQTPEELEAVYRLRYQVVTKRDWIRPEALPDGLEQDDYDGRSIHIVGWDRDKLAATTRLVFPTPGYLLPTEIEFGLKVEPSGQVVDGSRAIVAEAYSDYQHRIFAGLLAQSWFEISTRDFHYLCGTAVPAMIRLCRSLGYQITVLGPARLYWAERRYPIRFEVLEAAPALFNRWISGNNNLM